jgi:glycerate dehydrogenase
MKKLNIVLTDCNTVTSGDLDLSVLEHFGNVTYYGESLPDEIPERIKDADIVILNKTVLGKKELEGAKNLKLIALFATGYNNIDVKYARERGITVCNAGSYSTSAVAQQVFGFILANATRIAEYDRDVKDGAWTRSRLFCFFSRPASELQGKTLGIFGYGAIGRRVAEIAKAFEMNVIATTRTPKQDDIATFVDFDTLLRESDYLSVNCPLNDGTRELFDANAFSKMKKGAYFINTARGGVIVEQDLVDALKSGHLSGAAVDVLTVEPMRADCPLINAPNITFTPHVAWAPIETRRRLLSIVCDNIDNFLNGTPTNVVN